jgi:hypothetical protein
MSIGDIVRGGEVVVVSKATHGGNCPITALNMVYS